MRCENCKEELPKEAVTYCPSCGHQIVNKPQKKNPIITAIKVIVGIFCVSSMIVTFFSSVLFGVMSITEKDFIFLIPTVILMGIFLLVALVMGKICGSVKETFRIIGICIAGFVFIALVALVFSSSEVGGEAGLALLSFSIISLSIGTFVFGIVKKKKKVIIITIIVVSIYSLMLIGVVNDEPYFIRKIQGEDFISVWAIYALIVLVIAFITEVIYTIAYSKGKCKIAKEKIYADSDLMLLQNFDRYKLIGYYLLKAKLHNIIKYSITESSEESDSMVIVDINPDIGDEKLKKYCAENPQVNKIVDFIKSQKATVEDSGETEKHTVRVADVIYNVIPNPEIQSDGGLFATNCIEKIRKVTKTIFWLGIGLIYYLNTTKLMMGMYNEKETSNLIFTYIFGGFIVVGLYFINSSIIKSLIEERFIKKIIDFKSANFKNINRLFKNVNFENDNFSDEEIKMLLRAYSVYTYNTKDYPAIEASSQYSTAIFSAVSTAQLLAAAAARASSSGSGCSSCSGCGSCGGGCGGCGGCGD